MKKHFARAALAAALLCSSSGAAVLLTATPVMAEQSVSRAVGTALNDAIKAAQAKDFKTAQEKVQEAEAASGKTDFDEYKINQIKAFIAIQQNDYTTATAAYEAMIASSAFSGADDADKKSTLHNAILLSGQAQHWPQVINAAKQLEALNAMDDKTYTILAQAYYFTDDFANAQQTAQKAIDIAKANGQKPQESALQIIMSAQAKSNDQAGALKTLEDLAVNYGDAQTWGQLIDNAMVTKGLSELDALYLYRLRFLSNATAAAEDYTTAAGIALHIGYPAEAKADLEKGFASGKLSRGGRAAALLAQANDGTRADERSLKAIASAAERSAAGEQDVKLAEDYWGYGRYGDAVAAARRGISKGHLKDPSEGQFILGMALLAQGQIADAQQALTQIDGNPARAKAAHVWSLYAQYKANQAAAAATPAAAPQ